MWVIGAQQGWLAECYRPSGSTPPQVNLLPLAADEQWFEEQVLERLRRVAQLLALLASCQRTQDEFLGCSSRGAFVEEWCGRGALPVPPPLAAPVAAGAQHPPGTAELEMLPAPPAAALAGAGAAAGGGRGGEAECGAAAAGEPLGPAVPAPVTPPAAAVGSGPAVGCSPSGAHSWLCDSEQGYGQLDDQLSGSPDCYTQRSECPGCYTQPSEAPECYTQRVEAPSCYTQRSEAPGWYSQPSEAPECYTQHS